MPRVRARLLLAEMSVRKSCAPAICSALPSPVTQRQASSCPKLPASPHPIMPDGAAAMQLSMPLGSWTPDPHVPDMLRHAPSSTPPTRLAGKQLEKLGLKDSLTKGGDERPPDEQRLAPKAVRKDAGWQVHHQARNGVDADRAAHCCSAHSKALQKL